MESHDVVGYNGFQWKMHVHMWYKGQSWYDMQVSAKPWQSYDLFMAILMWNMITWLVVYLPL